MTESKQVSTQTAKPLTLVQELDAYEPQLRDALPSNIPVERFKRVVVTALNTNPDLAKQDRRSLFLALVKCAQDGLIPDGREAALVPFDGKVNYLPMYQGILKRMRNTGDIASVGAYVAYSNDKFSYALGDSPHITHEPALNDRGKPIAAYVIFTLTNGERVREVMSVDEIEKVRGVSKMKNGVPWTQWWDQQARKTVIKRGSKYVPMSAEAQALLDYDTEVTQEKVATDPETAQLPPPSRLDAFEQKITAAAKEDAHAAEPAKPKAAKAEKPKLEAVPSDPASPLVTKSAAQWPAWSEWCITTLSDPATDQTAFLKKYEAEMDWIAENRKGDWAMIAEATGKGVQGE